jgi:hypothetical protein
MTAVNHPSFVATLARMTILGCLLTGPTWTAPAVAQAPAANPSDTRNTALAVPGFSLLGFRSARFGMTEEELLSAIRQDFKVDPTAVRRSTHAIERTTVLTITVPDLLPGGGKAEIAYVLGFNSKKLMQVGLSWTLANDNTLTSERLIANANLLATTLRESGYPAERVTLNQMAGPGGLVVFRGSDSTNRTAVLILQGAAGPGKVEGETTLTPDSLSLIYIVDPAKPDIFRLEPGRF